MNDTVKDFVKKKAQELIEVPYCCEEAKAAVRSWLDAIGTEQEAGQAKKMIAELEEDRMTADEVLSFAESDAGVQAFGEEAAKNVAAHAREIKSAGEVYCDCEACAAVTAILEKKNELL